MRGLIKNCISGARVARAGEVVFLARGLREG